MDEQTKIKAKNKSIKKPKGAYDSNQVIQQKISKIDDVFLKNASSEFIDKVFKDASTIILRDDFIKKVQTP